MPVSSVEQSRRMTPNEDRRVKLGEVERHNQRRHDGEQSHSDYSSTYFETAICPSETFSAAPPHPASNYSPNAVPFIGGRVAVGPKSVGLSVVDTRIHYTHVAADEDGVACEDTQTFGGPRSVTSGWTTRIQRRMFLTIRQLDLGPIESSPHSLALIVLKFPKTVRTNRELATKAREQLIAALNYKLNGRRAHPLVWNFEFHWDGNCHFNFLMAFPSSSYEWLLKKWAKIAKHSTEAMESEVLHITRFADFDEDGVELSFEDQFYNAAAYMAGLGELLGFIKAHQYNIPEDWTPEGEGSGRMWGARGLGRAKVVSYPIENLAQKEAIEVYMAPYCPEKLTEYRNPTTGEVTIFNDGAYSPTRRAGSIQCLAVTQAMHEEILDLLELHANTDLPSFTNDYAEMPNARLMAAKARRLMRPFWERDDFDIVEFIAAQEVEPEADIRVAAEAEDIRPLTELLAQMGFSPTGQKNNEITDEEYASGKDALPAEVDRTFDLVAPPQPAAAPVTREMVPVRPAVDQGDAQPAVARIPGIFHPKVARSPLRF